jgi:RNA 3'-terminal phosphate cyclase (ATP)
MLTLDGSQGEGGGQILRTALSLSMCTGLPFRIEKIRAKRKTPGLMRQHLTAVQAAATICRAEVIGAHVGSEALEFSPGKVVPGEYEFSVGTAGSATLVFQTLLPALMLQPAASKLTLRGGTHNPMAPPFHFLERAFLPVLKEMGVGVNLQLNRHGFYPAGGGEFTASILPAPKLKPINLIERGKSTSCYAESIIAGVPGHVAKRELELVRQLMSIPDDQCFIRGLSSEQGPGNALLITLGHEHVTEVVCAFGEKSTSAETVAMQAVGAARKYTTSAGAVGEHLADQLLLPLALCGKGEMKVTTVSRHTLTNAEVIQKFLPLEIETSPSQDGAVLIQCQG